MLANFLPFVARALFALFVLLGLSRSSFYIVMTYVPVRFSRVDLQEVPIYVITCADLRYVNTSNLY